MKLTEARPPLLGTLRDRIVLQKHDAENDIYVPLATVWARVTPPQVVLRYRNDLRAGDLVEHRGRVYDITEASDLNGRRAYLCLTIAGRADLSEKK